MGLAKSIEFKSTGIMMTYWRINMVKVDILTNLAEVRIDGYTSKADCLLGRSPVESISREFLGMDNPITLMTDPRDYQGLLYAKFSAQPEPGQVNPLAGATPISDTPD